MLQIDHDVYAVRDLEAAATRVLEELGLASVPGGVHPKWGTGNRIIPLGDGQYLELLAVVDPAVAATTHLGRSLQTLTADGDAWFAMCLATDAIDAVAARVGLNVVPGSRTLPDGRSPRADGQVVVPHSARTTLPLSVNRGPTT